MQVIVSDGEGVIAVVWRKGFAGCGHFGPGSELMPTIAGS